METGGTVTIIIFIIVGIKYLLSTPEERRKAKIELRQALKKTDLEVEKMKERNKQLEAETRAILTTSHLPEHLRLQNQRPTRLNRP
jgi:hypothetical protein